jgi:hypothetical protein
MESWTKSWGFSGLVGEWHLEVPGGHGDDFDGRFSRLVEVLERTIPLLSRLHRLQKAQIDISLLSEEIQENGEIKEEAFFEDVELDATSLEDLVPALKQVIQSYTRGIVTRLNIDLDTIVVEEAGEIIFPESAELYIGTNSYAQIEKEVDLYVAFSTFIDVWLKKTFEPDGELRDNIEPSNRNYPRLQGFLQNLEESLEGKLIAGESHYYSESLRKTGFI